MWNPLDAPRLCQNGPSSARDTHGDLDRHIFEDTSADCHQYDGDGRQNVYAL
jgi:hypothetical protein